MSSRLGLAPEDCSLTVILYSGRERRARLDTLETRHITRANICVGGVYLQAVRAALNHHKESEVLSHQREPQLQHCQKYREEDL
jgi:hypothetical protein